MYSKGVVIINNHSFNVTEFTEEFNSFEALIDNDEIYCYLIEYFEKHQKRENIIKWPGHGTMGRWPGQDFYFKHESGEYSILKGVFIVGLGQEMNFRFFKNYKKVKEEEINYINSVTINTKYNL